ncbi:unnamed protein product [Closterium sp. NIES-65]|nr:unnamed protein product [Closterium sp. NIES-65]
MQHLRRNNETPQYHDALPRKRQLSIRKHVNASSRAAVAGGRGAASNHVWLHQRPHLHAPTQSAKCSLLHVSALVSFSCHFFTLRPLAAYSPALRVCLAGGGEGCGISIAIPSRLSPVAVQGGTHTGRRGGGLPGKESPGTPQVQPLGLWFVTWPPPVAPPLSRLANAVPSHHSSSRCPLTSSACALQVEGRGGGQHRRFPTLLPCGRAGTCGDGREATLPVAAARESIGVGLASQAAVFVVVPGHANSTAVTSSPVCCPYQVTWHRVKTEAEEAE